MGLTYVAYLANGQAYVTLSGLSRVYRFAAQGDAPCLQIMPFQGWQCYKIWLYTEMPPLVEPLTGQHIMQ